MLYFLDEDDTIRYRVTEVTNGGKRKFYVNPSTGTNVPYVYIMRFLYIVNPSECFLKAKILGNI